MNYTDIIVAIITALSTGGVLSAFMNRKQRKIMDRIDADSKVSDQWHDIFESEKQNRIEVQQRLNYMYNENTQLRVALDKANSKAIALSILRCGRINCDLREPPFGNTVDLDSDGNIVFRNYKYPEAKNLKDVVADMQDEEYE